MKKILPLIAVLIVVGAGAWFLLKDKPTNNTQTSTSTSGSQTQNQTSPSSAEQQPAANNATPTSAKKITYTNSGFQPAILTVNSGDTIEIVNDSSAPLQFDSNPHPNHTDNTELNVGTVNAGESKTFTVTTKGNWQYHNHLNTSRGGEIHVQ